MSTEGCSEQACRSLIVLSEHRKYVFTWPFFAIPFRGNSWSFSNLMFTCMSIRSALVQYNIILSDIFHVLISAHQRANASPEKEVHRPLQKRDLS